MSGAADRGLATRNAGIALAVVALIAVAGVFWWRGRQADGPADGGGIPPATADVSGPGEGSGAASGPSGEPITAALDDARRADASRMRDAWRERLGVVPEFPEPLAGAATCERVDAELARICAALDAGVALEGAAAQHGSCAFMRDAAERLAARPPAVPEARDTDAWLRNAFHLFRALGPERLRTARQLAEAEPTLIEPLALAAYRWAVTRESCRDQGEPVAGLTPARVYDYGAFAFTSFGGQAYLRRRAPRLEALGCFYALSALELSIDQGHNPHGVDPRREIERCRALVASQPLAWSAEYDRELQRMANAWRKRAGAN